MPRPIHFEIPAENPHRAMAFYSQVFGWEFTKWDGPITYWSIRTGGDSEPGIDGGLLPQQSKDQPCVNTIRVDNLDMTIALVAAAGGTTVLSKMAVPGVGWIAYCRDTEGHVFGIIQLDESAR